MALVPALAPPATVPEVPSLLEGRIVFESAPAWADALDFDASAPRHNEDSLTCLLHHEQLHAEAGSTFTRIVLRLESVQAVHQFSQWRLDLDSLSQRLALHTLRVRRGDGVIEHACPAKVRLLQRDEGPVSFVQHGHYTLVTLFEDVRPGDCLEVAYTLTHRPLLLADNFHRLLFLPAGYEIHRYEWSVLHRPERGLRYLGSPSLGAPEIDAAGHAGESGLIRWTWSGSLRERLAPEEHTPPWLFPDPWLQLSDLPDWGAVARGVADAWFAEAEDEPLASEIRRIEAEAASQTMRVELALRLVQDDFRHLDVNLEPGGPRPAPPGEVLRRRYGDRKDLARLLCHLLGGLGVTARPVLVHSELGPRLAKLLPSPALFNHAVVEFTLEGETRWVDPTLRAQGGGPLGRSLKGFSFGLPVDASASALRTPPAAASPLGDIQEIHETVLLDTRGASSRLRFRQCLTGHHADAFRRSLQAATARDFQNARTEFFASRYGDAENESPIACEDDRERNVLRTIEVYRVRGFVDLTRGGGRCAVTLPPSFALLALPRPGTGERRAPWSINHPLRIEHTMEVMASSLPAQPPLGQSFADKAITLSFKRKFPKGRWFQTLSLTSVLPSVAGDDVEGHARTLEAANAQCAWGMFAIAGLARPHRRHSFHEMLPAPLATSRMPTWMLSSSDRSSAAGGTPAGAENTAYSAASPVSRSSSLKQRGVQIRAGKRRKPISPWLWLIAAVVIAGGVSAYYLYKDRNEPAPTEPATFEIP